MSQQTIETVLLKILHEVKEIKKQLQPTELDRLQNKLKELENRVELLETFRQYQPLRPFPGTGTDPYYPVPPVVYCKTNDESTTKFPINEVVGEVENGGTKLK